MWTCFAFNIDTHKKMLNPSLPVTKCGYNEMEYRGQIARYKGKVGGQSESGSWSQRIWARILGLIW